MIEQLPESLQHLVAAETAAPVTSRAAQAHVRARLGTTLGIAAVAAAGTATGAGTTAAVGTATAGTASAAGTAGTAIGTAAAGTAAAVKSAVALKLLAVVLGIGAGAAVTTVAVTRDRDEPARPAVTQRTKPTQPAKAPHAATLRVEPIEDDVTPAVVEPPPSEPPRPRMKHVAPPPPPEPAAAPTAVQAPVRSQSQLLADATRSLSLGDAARALELIDEDTRAHATGPLVEEREALRISALTALGRTAEAQDAARTLLATYPHSIHRRLAERVLAKETP